MPCITSPDTETLQQRPLLDSEASMRSILSTRCRVELDGRVMLYLPCSWTVRTYRTEPVPPPPSWERGPWAGPPGFTSQLWPLNRAPWVKLRKSSQLILSHSDSVSTHLHAGLWKYRPLNEKARHRKCPCLIEASAVQQWLNSL